MQHFLYFIHWGYRENFFQQNFLITHVHYVPGEQGAQAMAILITVVENQSDIESEMTYTQ